MLSVAVARLGVGLAFSLALAGAAGPVPGELERRVLDLGGSLQRGPSGEIRAIDLSRSWVTDVDLEWLRDLDGLEGLALGQTHISDAALRAVAAINGLRRLDLFFCEHVTDSGASALRAAADLERLNVRGTKISDSGLKFITELRRLRELDLGITEISDASIELLEALPRLESLAIGGNRIGELGVAGLRALKGLRELDLSGAQVTDSGVWAVGITDLTLGEIGAMSSLESLNLAAPSQEYVLAISSGVPRIRGGIRVSDFGAKHLARLAGLRKLNLTRSTLTSEGLETLGRLTALEELVLAHVSTIGDGSGPALARLASLEVLDLSYTGVGDAALDALVHHPRLRRVGLVGTKVSAEAVDRFVRASNGREVIR